MDIRTALDNLVTMEEGLSITSPDSLSILKAWKYMAPQEQLAPDTPCFMNTWQLVSDEPHQYGSPPDRFQRYAVNAQLFVKDADAERAADIATAFHVALVTAFEADPTLGDTVFEATMRGGDPTLVILDRGGQSYMGLNLFFDLELKV